MNVETIATKDVVTVRESDSMLSASRLIKQNGIRHLPGLDDRERLVGVVTDRDIRQASASEAISLEAHELVYLLSQIRVENIMTKNAVTVSRETEVPSAAKQMIDYKIGCLPVVGDGQLVGIVTRTDFLKLLARGEGQPS